MRSKCVQNLVAAPVGLYLTARDRPCQRKLELNTFAYSCGNRYSWRVYSVSKSVEAWNIKNGSVHICPTDCSLQNYVVHSCDLRWPWIRSEGQLTLILRRSRTGTVWFYTSTNNKRAARPKLYTKSLTGDLKRMYSRFTLVRISIKH